MPHAGNSSATLSPLHLADDRSPIAEDQSAGWLKIDFHLHASEDPFDELDHSAFDLLHKARSLGFGALAITLHSHVLTRQEVFDAARELGILLIPAAEMRLEGADVVIVNLCEEEAAELRRLRDLEGLRKRRGDSVFIFAPHPFYILGGSIGSHRLIEHIDLFDAVELSHFHTRFLNPNRNAYAIAERFGKPLLATSDAHRLDFFGDHYTLVDVGAGTGGNATTPEAIFNAIRAGAFRSVSPPWPLPRFLQYAWWVLAVHEFRLLQARIAGH